MISSVEENSLFMADNFELSFEFCDKFLYLGAQISRTNEKKNVKDAHKIWQGVFVTEAFSFCQPCGKYDHSFGMLIVKFCVRIGIVNSVNCYRFNYEMECIPSANHF